MCTRESEAMEAIERATQSFGLPVASLSEIKMSPEKQSNNSNSDSDTNTENGTNSLGECVWEKEIISKCMAGKWHSTCIKYVYVSEGVFWTSELKLSTDLAEWVLWPGRHHAIAFCF